MAMGTVSLGRTWLGGILVALAGSLACGATASNDGAPGDSIGLTPRTGPQDTPGEGPFGASTDAGAPGSGLGVGSPPAGSVPGSNPVPNFRQGLFRGEDPRVRQVNGTYYSVLTEGGVRKLYKSKSLIDRGEGKVTPPVGDAYFPLFAPVYIGRLGGQTYNRWFAFDDNEWECNCKDPYDNIDQWRVVQKLPFTGWSIDFEIFQNSQPGPFQNKTYLLWAGADTPPKGWWFESVFAAELLDLRPGTKVLSTYDNNDQNRVVSYGFDWTDVIAEAPAPAIRGNSVSVVYSGNGAQTDDYALGVAMLKAGTNPAEGSNWINYNRGACDGDSRRAPEFAKTDGVFGPGVARFTKSRQIHAQPIGWRDVACGGASYTIPNLGKPVPPPGCS